MNNIKFKFKNNLNKKQILFERIRLLFLFIVLYILKCKDQIKLTITYLNRMSGT